MYVCTICLPGAHGVHGEGVRSASAGLTDSCELSCGCWESNPGPF